jgi:hypothetical protein
MRQAQSIMEDVALPDSVKLYFASHASVRSEGSETVVFLRGRPYYESLSSQSNSHQLYTELTEISSLVKSFDVEGGRILSPTERDALLCLLDHGKAYSLRLLNGEVERGFSQDNGKSIQAYSDCAEHFVDDYYKTLLRVTRQDSSDHSLGLPAPHQLDEQEQAEFNDLMREMDQPLPIAMQVNYIAEEMKKPA